MSSTRWFRKVFSRSSAIKASLAIDEVLMKENVVNESSKVLSVASGGVGKKRKAVGVTPQANKKLRSDSKKFN